MERIGPGWIRIAKHFWIDAMYFFGLNDTKNFAANLSGRVNIIAKVTQTFSTSAWTTCLLINGKLFFILLNQIDTNCIINPTHIDQATAIVKRPQMRSR